MKRQAYPLLPGIDDDLPFGRKEPPEEQPPPVAKEFRPPRHNDLSLYICHQYEAERIFQRKSDGYFDATAMCRAFGKLWGHYRQDRLTAKYVAKVESLIGMPISLLIESNRSGPYRTRGTWVHPEIAIDLGHYLDDEFRAVVNHWVYQWWQTRTAIINRDDVEPFVIGRMWEAIERIDERAERMENGAVARIDRRLAQMELNLLRSEKEEQISTFVIDAQAEPPPQANSGRPKYGWDELDRLVRGRSSEAGR